MNSVEVGERPLPTFSKTRSKAAMAPSGFRQNLRSGPMPIKNLLSVM